MTSSGPGISREDAFRRRDAGEFIWRTAQGMYLTMEMIDDGHLLNIELHLMGRSSYHKPESYGPGEPNWESTYKIIRDEIERRGLELREATGAKPSQVDERFVHHTCGYPRRRWRPMC